MTLVIGAGLTEASIRQLDDGIRSVVDADTDVAYGVKFGAVLYSA